MAPFKYFDKGSMATIGYRYAVADSFGRKFTGLIAYLMWAFIHMLYLIGWGNRLGTIYTWLRALVFSNNRGHRIITFERANDETTEHVGTVRPGVVIPAAPSTNDASAAKSEASRSA